MCVSGSGAGTDRNSTTLKDWPGGRKSAETEPRNRDSVLRQPDDTVPQSQRHTAAALSASQWHTHPTDGRDTVKRRRHPHPRPWQGIKACAQ